MKRKLILKFIGMDSWDRPVYEDKCGTLWKDVNPRKRYASSLCSSVNNEYEGEPDMPINSEIEVIFKPERITWD